MKEYNIFISHAWKYSDDYLKVVSWLNDAQSERIFTWKNYSVPKHDPLIDPDTSIGKKKLKELLKEQIRSASVVIIISGMYAARREWIDYEIDTSIMYLKSIIGLKPWGQERIPSKISENAKMVGWNKSSLISAIKEL